MFLEDKTGFQLCDICYEEQHPREFFALDTCPQHSKNLKFANPSIEGFGFQVLDSFCKGCIEENLEYKITHGEVNKIPCLQDKCKNEFKREDI